MRKRSVIIKAGGGGPAEPVLSKQSELAYNVKSNAKGGEPAEVAERHPRLNPCEKLNVILNSERSERDSGSVPRCELPLTLARFRNRLARLAKNGTAKSVVFALCLRSLAQFGMTLKEMTRVCAFTMAEILLSLTIIGVVAAITLPSLTGNINERTWNTQRKALYARFSQAIALMPALNGYGTLTEGDSSTSAVDTAAETFVTAGLSKVLKINNICDYEHLADCGIPDAFTNLKGSKVEMPVDIVELNSFFTSGSWRNGDFAVSYSQINTKAVAFETVNGESLVTYYNPRCRYRVDKSSAGFSQPDMCANFIYDLNGKRGPNTVGKDIGFITVMYPADSSVFMPMPYAKTAGNASVKNANKLCQTNFGEEARLPNRNELAAVAFNSLLTGDYSENDAYWTSTPSGQYNNTGYYWYNIKSGLYRTDLGPDTLLPVVCIKR